jgi:8-oxo-dGTP pyrophosphatase MutT (NUDIX family)
MSYILELRAVVGHRPIICPGSTVLILDVQNRVLLQHRTDTKTWGTIGGSSELGESLEETAVREALEEANITILELEFLGILSGKKYFFEYPNGDQIYNVGAVYVSRNWTGIPKADGLEGSEVRFFALDELPELQNSLTINALEMLKKYLERQD